MKYVKIIHTQIQEHFTLFQYKDHLSRYKNSDYKDETVLSPEWEFIY